MKRFSEISLIICHFSLWAIIGMLLPNSLIAQSTFNRHYATQAVDHRLLQENPAIADNRLAIEAFINNFQLQENLVPITIPVVFHVIQRAESDPITKDQLLIQLAALNRDFAGQLIPSPSQTVQAEGFALQQAVDIGIQFCLAQSTAETGSKEGIVYKISEQNWTTDDALKSEATGGLFPWNPNQYLNIWIADLGDNLTGYAQMPGGPAVTDGIVLHPRFLASKEVSNANHLGRVLTHLMGSYLGLYELWQPNCQDDFCADTPIHNAPNLGCEDYKHISFCPPHQAEMTMNFMDIGTAACEPYMFTLDQSKRMHAILNGEGPRATLATGASSTICANEVATQRNAETSLAKRTEEVLKVQLHPNPAQTDFTLAVISPITKAVEVVIYDNLGQVHYETALITSEKLRINTASWQSGIYYVFIRADQQAQTHQLVILPK